MSLHKSGRFLASASIEQARDWKLGTMLYHPKLKITVQFKVRKYAFAFVGLVINAPKKSDFKQGEEYSCFYIQEFERIG